MCTEWIDERFKKKNLKHNQELWAFIYTRVVQQLFQKTDVTFKTLIILHQIN